MAVRDRVRVRASRRWLRQHGRRTCAARELRAAGHGRQGRARARAREGLGRGRAAPASIFVFFSSSERPFRLSWKTSDCVSTQRRRGSARGDTGRTGSGAQPVRDGTVRCETVLRGARRGAVTGTARHSIRAACGAARRLTLHGSSSEAVFLLQNSMFIFACSLRHRGGGGASSCS